MGTRAVVHCDLQPFQYGKDLWIATHWDGDPDSLGKELKKALEKIKKSDDKGGDLQEHIVAVCAKHHIDEMSTNSKPEFDKRYGDFAEYLYEVTPSLELKTKELHGEWGKKMRA